MKIDKRNARHWAYLFMFACNVMIALMLRPFFKSGQRPLVLLYGHKLSGNLLALYRELRSNPGGCADIAFLTMDPAYHRELSEAGERSVLAISPASIRWLAKADAIVSDHGLHVLLPLLFASSIKFFDVWHSIPFKGFDGDDFRVQHYYDEVWVPSPLLAEMYVRRFGFAAERVVVTGYARTDRLVRYEEDAQATRRLIGAPPEGALILFAPTWAQDASGRSIYPFGHTEQEFLQSLSDAAGRLGATVLLRTHLNSGTSADTYPNVLHVPFSRYPDTEGILLASDVLVGDWSSIAFDYLLLGRPAIFLDVPAPFRKGFSLGAEYRYGAIATDLDAMLGWIDICLGRPSAYWEQHQERHADVRRAVYGGYDDGRATERCLRRLYLHMDRSVQR